LDSSTPSDERGSNQDYMIVSCMIDLCESSHPIGGGGGIHMMEKYINVIQ
jgi:hypothetical protein